MKKFYFLNTNAYECVVSVEDEVVRCLVENNWEPFPHDADNGHTSPHAAKEFLCRIEDDSSWEELENVNSIEDLFSEGGYELVASVDEVDTQAFSEPVFEQQM